MDNSGYVSTQPGQGYVSTQQGYGSAQSGQAFITKQPGAANPYGTEYGMKGNAFPMMANPVAGKGDTYTGLEYLTAVDELMCYQDVHLMEVLTGWEVANRYRIVNSLEQQVYTVFEEPESMFQLQCCGRNRGFKLHVRDNSDQDVFVLDRPFQCCAGWPYCADGCSMYPIEVKDKFEQKIGMVRMMTYYCNPYFGLFDQSNNLLYDLRGPCCPYQGPCCTADIDFPIRSWEDGSQVANVAKVWGGFFADTYRVRFPIDLDVTHKALMIASIFLLDFSLFER